MGAERQLIVFAKAPVLGRVKTRMTRDGHLNERQARALYVASLLEVWRRQAGRHPSALHVSAAHPLWAALGFDETRLVRQRGEDLGEKMFNALSSSLCGERSHSAAIILGTDSPQLDPRSVDEAFAALLDAEERGEPTVSYGPAMDGGYVWVGLNRCGLTLAEPLFRGMEWSTSEVLNESLRRADRLGLRVQLGEPSWDLDERQDLARLLSERELSAPHERVWLGGGFDAFELAPPQEPELKAAYRSALTRLFALTRFGERMDLETPRALNRELGAPLSAYRSLLIGGTNGKGSCSAHLSALAEEAGLRVGRFTSPHLISFRERLCLNGRPVSHDLIVEGVDQVFRAAERAQLTMSFFEATWALAAWCFRELGAEWVIWEVGLGGRLDATNVCDPVVSAITSIGLDHTHVLGDSLSAIAAEKAPISRPGRPALTAASGAGGEALRELAPQFKAAPPLGPELSAALKGRLHPQNAALAIAIAQEAGWSLSAEARSRALSRFEWPGRLESLLGFTLDCAHNPHAMSSLAAWLKEQRSACPQLKVRCVLGASADKDIEGAVALLAPHLDELTLVSPQYPRCLSAAELQLRLEDVLAPLSSQLKLSLRPSVSEALAELEGSRGGEGGRGERDQVKELDLVTGSCFVVGEARAWLLGLPFPELGLLTTAR